MRINIKKIFAIFLIVLCAFSTSFVSFAEDGMTEEEKLRLTKSQSIIDKINADKKKIQSTIKNLNALKNDTQNYI